LASLLAFAMRLKRKERENGKGTRENGMKRAVLLALSLNLQICHMLGDTNEESQLQQKTLKQTLCSCSQAEMMLPL
uniref:Uncharacterized protein n=1 Tax=Otus sunia TaxID=257818 RepID=A0A8C8A5A9_9STRI